MNKPNETCHGNKNKEGIPEFSKKIYYFFKEECV